VPTLPVGCLSCMTSGLKERTKLLGKSLPNTFDDETRVLP